MLVEAGGLQPHVYMYSFISKLLLMKQLLLSKSPIHHLLSLQIAHYFPSVIIIWL